MPRHGDIEVKHQRLSPAPIWLLSRASRQARSNDAERRSPADVAAPQKHKLLVKWDILSPQNAGRQMPRTHQVKRLDP